jgi:hypothetical protein
MRFCKVSITKSDGIFLKNSQIFIFGFQSVAHVIDVLGFNGHSRQCKSDWILNNFVKENSTKSKLKVLGKLG